MVWNSGVSGGLPVASDHIDPGQRSDARRKTGGKQRWRSSQGTERRERRAARRFISSRGHGVGRRGCARTKGRNYGGVRAPSLFVAI